MLGIGLGWLLGQGAVRLVTRTINDLYYVLSVNGAPLTALAAAKGAALGIGAGVLSAVAPALEAARVQPVDALRRSDFERRARRLLPAAGARRRSGRRRRRRSCILLAGRSLLASFAGLFGIVVGFALRDPDRDGSGHARRSRRSPAGSPARLGGWPRAPCCAPSAAPASRSPRWRWPSP